MNRAALAAIMGLALLAAAPAQAVFQRTLYDRVDPEAEFDDEYFLDLLGFSYPSSWEQAWSVSTGGYRVNGASLDCCTLLLNQQLRFQRRLTEGLLFRYELEQNEDKDHQELHHWLAFEQRIYGGLSAEIVGEPTFRKEDSDIGFGLAWRRPGLLLRARRLFVDWNFNKRNSSTQRYDRLPITDQAEARIVLAAEALAARIELDHPLRLRVPAENRLLSYRRTRAALSWSRPAASWRPAVEYSYEFEKRGSLVEPDLALESRDFRRNIHRLAASATVDLSPRDTLEAGQATMIRAARSDSPTDSRRGVYHRRWELHPYARWRRLHLGWLESELATFMAFGENRRYFPGQIEPSPLRAIVEAKIGTGLDFIYGPSARLGVYSTFDADSPDRRFWDGGNVRAMFLF